MSIHFYCTRCRHLLEYPQSSCGTVIYCPFCQQPIIVPTLLSFDNKDEESDSSIPERNENERYENEIDSNERDVLSDSLHSENDLCSKIDVVSHFFPLLSEKENAKKDQFKSPSEDSLKNAQISEAQTGQKDENLLIANKSLSDQEFWNILRLTPSDPLYKPPVIATPFEESEEYWERRENEKRNSNFLGEKINYIIVVGVIIVSIICLGTLGKIIFSQYYRSSKPLSEQAMISEIMIDGRLTFNNSRQRLQADEGSVIFLIPENFPQGTQLLLGNLSARQKNSEFPKESEQLLKENGGFFARTDANGSFDFVVPKAGKYNVFLISAHLPLQNKIDEKQWQEINRIFYRPDRSLLKGSRFIWDECYLDENNKYLEYSFGNDTQTR